MGDSVQSIEALAKRFFDAIEKGDPDTIHAIYADDAAIWHNFDRTTIDRDENLKTLRGFIKTAPKRNYTDRRLTAYPGGFVQQHLLVAELPDGKVLELPACIVCAVANGRITRLDEYFDPKPLEAWRA